MKLLHHPNKTEVAAGMMARGSGALGSFVDITIEQTWYTSGSDNDRRRRLVALSRHTATPRQLVIELNADGTDYVGHGSFEDQEFTQSWKMIQSIRAGAPKKLTRQEIRRHWPADMKPPDKRTLWRWLERALALLREGTGWRNEPYRYWLPGDEEKLKRPAWEKEVAELIERINRECDEITGEGARDGGK